TSEIIHERLKVELRIERKPTAMRARTHFIFRLPDRRDILHADATVFANTPPTESERTAFAPTQGDVVRHVQECFQALLRAYVAFDVASGFGKELTTGHRRKAGQLCDIAVWIEFVLEDVECWYLTQVLPFFISDMCQMFALIGTSSSRNQRKNMTVTNR